MASFVVMLEIRSSSFSSASFASFSFSCSSFECVSRSETPCSRRVSSVSLPSISSSFASTRSSILMISARRCETSCSTSARSLTDCSRASI